MWRGASSVNEFMTMCFDQATPGWRAVSKGRRSSSSGPSGKRVAAAAAGATAVAITASATCEDEGCGAPSAALASKREAASHRSSAMHTVRLFHGKLTEEMGGKMRLHALMSLQSYTDSLDPAERMPSHSSRLAPHEEARLAREGTWYATLCSASYGSRGACWFGAWSVAAKAGAGAEAGAVVGAAAGAAVAGSPGVVADAAAAGAVLGSDGTDEAAEAVSSLAERASHAWSMLGAAAVGGDLGVFAHATGLRQSDVLFHRMVAKPRSPAHMLVRDDARRELVLVIRGTISEDDIITDVAAHEVGFLTGKGHEAMVMAAYDLYANLMDDGPEGIGLRRHLRDHPGYRFVIAGHSLGGGVGTMLHTLMHRQAEHAAAQRRRAALLRGAGGGPKEAPGDDDTNNVTPTCWSFGAPPALRPLSVVSPGAAASLMQVVVGDDIVPRLSLWSLMRLARLLRHLDAIYPARSVAQAVGMAEVSRPPLGVAIIRAKALWAEEAAELAGRGRGAGTEGEAKEATGAQGRAGKAQGAAHARAEDETGQDGEAESEDGMPSSRLWLPGRILFVGSPGTLEARHIREAPVESFADIVPSSRSLPDHLPTTYVSSLRAVAEGAAARRRGKE